MTKSKGKTPRTPRSGKSAVQSKSASKSRTRSKSVSSQAGDDALSAQEVTSGEPSNQNAASRLIDQRILDLGGWRGEALARMRSLILAADPEMTEEWKWKGTPVWSHHGIVCTGEAYRNVVKLTFAHGASLADPARLFNSSLEGNTRRAIDIHEGEQVEATAFKKLVKAAVTRNAAAKNKPRSVAKQTGPAKASGSGKVVLLSGGNPQIAKGDGDAPVQAYIAAMPGWKSGLGKRVDAIIERNVPDVQKAVRWNSPFYGVEGRGWIVSFHVFTKYVKVTFFNGLALRPVPPGGTEKSKKSRWIDIYEDDELDEEQMATWMQQAAAVPGWIP